MNNRYSPWWMPTALVILLMTSMFLFGVLVFDRAPKTSVHQTTEVNSTTQRAQSVYNWRLVTSWPKKFPGLGMAPENFADRVKALSEGRLNITVYGANEIVPALGVFGAVSAGSAEMGHSAAYYWKGKMPAAAIFTTIPFGLTAQEMNAWLHHGGGLELWRELYEPYNLIPFAGGSTGIQMGGWFNREINTLDDIKGLKMRIPGFGGEVFTRAGGTAVNIPAGELYTSLQSGVIDATEWAGPYNDLAFGFHQIAEYYYYPGWHEPGPILEFTVNKDAYESLPEDLQKIIEVAARAVNENTLDEYNASSASALEELENVHNVDVRRFPQDVLDTFREMAFDIYDETAKTDPAFEKIYSQYKAYMKASRRYSEITDKAYFDVR